MISQEESGKTRSAVKESGKQDSAMATSIARDEADRLLDLGELQNGILKAKHRDTGSE